MVADQSFDDRPLHQLLRDHFGWEQFRPGQLEACRSVMEGGDTLVLMPTGSGKSLCYQLPGLLIPGVTLVISPLISLAADQAAHLQKTQDTVAVLNSSRKKSEIAKLRKNVAAGKIEFVFTTPERLQSTDLVDVLNQAGVSLMVIDEAHCVSQWGHDFRPDYLSLHHARVRLGNPRILAMTATAGERTRNEICDILHLSNVNTITGGIERPNLAIGVRHCRSDDKDTMLADLLSPPIRETTLVYCGTTKNAERLQVQYKDIGCPVMCYHGRMKKADRQTSQSMFMQQTPSLMFATNAFGLGIDKPDIRHVIHYDLPGSIEAYYQEFGRAGRDGNPSRCTLLYDRADIGRRKAFAGGYIKPTELSTAHRAMALTLQRTGGGTIASIKEMATHSPLSRSKLKSSLQMLASRGVVVPAGRGRWEMIVDDIGHRIVDSIAATAKSRSEQRQVAVRQMVEFAESIECRWRKLRQHFIGNDGQDWCDQCRCDQCGFSAAA